MRNAEKMTPARKSVYKLLKDGGKYSVARISAVTGLSDPRGHIRDLRAIGVNVLDEWRKSEYGGRYKVYFLPFH